MLPIQILADAHRFTFRTRVLCQHDIKLGYVPNWELSSDLILCQTRRNFKHALKILKYMRGFQKLSFLRTTCPNVMLNWMIDKKKYRMLQLLFAKGYFVLADIRMNNSIAFANACCTGSLRLVKFLANQGLNIMDFCCLNNYPIRSARQRGHDNIVKFLLQQLKPRK